MDQWRIATTEFAVANAVYPAVEIRVEHAQASVLIVHGFGGSKEEQLGLALRVARLGFHTIAIDLKGHGENGAPFDVLALNDVNKIVERLRTQGPVVTIGHSLGGRLSLLSGADYRVGISPALNQSYMEGTVTLVNEMRKYRVAELYEDVNFKLLKDLPLVDATLKPTDLVLYGSRDIPELRAYCTKLKERHAKVIEVPGALHFDIYLSERTFSLLRCYLGQLPLTEAA